MCCIAGGIGEVWMPEWVRVGDDGDAGKARAIDENEVAPP